MAADRIAASGLAISRPGDLRRRPVDRLVEPGRAVAEAGRGQHADRAGERARLVREDVPEHVGRDDDVELPRVPDELHGRVVDVHVAELDVRELRRRLGDGVPPQPRALRGRWPCRRSSPFFAASPPAGRRPGRCAAPLSGCSIPCRRPPPPSARRAGRARRNRCRRRAPGRCRCRCPGPAISGCSGQASFSASWRNEGRMLA